MYSSTKVRNTEKETRIKKNKTIGLSQEVQKENDVGAAEAKRHEGNPKTRLKMD